MRASQLSREGGGTGIAVRRQAGVPAARRRAQRVGREYVRVRTRGEVDGPRHRRARHEGIVGVQVRTGHIPLVGPVEREQPVEGMRFQAQGVRVRRARVREDFPALGSGPDAAPGASVGVVQYGSAPVALLRRRRGAGEAYAKGDLVRERELDDVARAHAIAEPGLCAASFRRQLPERCIEAREEQPQHHGDRQRLGRDASRVPQVERPSVTGRRGREAQQGRTGEPDDAEQVHQQPERFAAQERRQAQEIDDQREGG
jgi:hypothetical protein